MRQIALVMIGMLGLTSLASAQAVQSKSAMPDVIDFNQVVKDGAGNPITTIACGGTPDKPAVCKVGIVAAEALNFSSDPRSPPSPTNAALGWKVLSSATTGEPIKLSIDELSSLKNALLKLPAGGLGYATCRLIVPPEQCDK